MKEIILSNAVEKLCSTLFVIVASGFVSLPKFASSIAINSSSTLNPIKFAETGLNDFYTFAYEVSPIISYILQNETLKNDKNFSIGEIYHRKPDIVKDGTNFWKVRYCGVHFINKGDGFVLSDKPFEDPDDEYDINSRCMWGFVGNQFCTPQIECPSFKSNRGNCRTNYLQLTDGGESFLHHFCDDERKPETTPYTARNGVLDVVYRFSSPQKRPEFECWVKCVNYAVNYTVTGSNAVGTEKLKVTIHNPPKEIHDTLPPPEVSKNCLCGAQNGGSPNRTHRIVGGRETLVNQYPWTVGIMNRVGKLPYCGASLISAEYVLTAMHCVEDEELEDIIIALNEHDFFNDTETPVPTVRRNVIEVIPYHYYLDSTFSGDYALLRLEKPVSINESIFTPVCLPRPQDYVTQGREVIAAGWGTTSGGLFASKSPKLLEVPLVVMPNEACNDYHPHSPPEPEQVSENMLCAGYPEGGRDTCAGDSGGPLTIKMKDSGRFAQIGVTSWGYGCAIKFNPGVFSRVSSLMYWIRMHTVDGHFCLL